MKNVLKLSLLSAGFAIISATAIAQEAPKSGSSTTKTDKQEPVKTPPASEKSTATESTKTDKADTSKDGATRMAITEQGMPKKNKRSKKSAPPASTEAPKK